MTLEQIMNHQGTPEYCYNGSLVTEDQMFSIWINHVQTVSIYTYTEWLNNHRIN